MHSIRRSGSMSVGIRSCAAALALLVAGPFSGTPVGLTVFAVSSFLKDAVPRFGDLADDSFKP